MLKLTYQQKRRCFVMIPKEWDKEEVEKRLNKMDEENQWWDKDYLDDTQDSDEREDEKEKEENDYMFPSRIRDEWQFDDDERDR